MVTIDASVYIAAAFATDKYHTDSVLFLGKTRRLSTDIVCPALVLPECAGAVARRTGRASLAQHVLTLIGTSASLTLAPLGETLARQAADIARLYQLRGADAVYVAVAQAFGATLITWDTEVLQRGQAVVVTLTPTQAAVIL